MFFMLNALSIPEICLSIALTQAPEKAQEDARKIMEGNLSKSSIAECIRVNGENENALPSILEASIGGVSKPPKLLFDEADVLDFAETSIGGIRKPPKSQVEEQSIGNMQLPESFIVESAADNTKSIGGIRKPEK